MKIEMNKIKITLPDGSIKEFDSGVTPLEIAQSISSRLAKEALVAKIDGIVKDLNTSINKDSEVAILTFKDPEGRHAYWHSTSHLMAHAIQALYPEAKFGVGPAIENGFYYDFDLPSTLVDKDLKVTVEGLVSNSIYRMYVDCRTRHGPTFANETIEVTQPQSVDFNWTSSNSCYNTISPLSSSEDRYICLERNGSTSCLVGSYNTNNRGFGA